MLYSPLSRHSALYPAVKTESTGLKHGRHVPQRAPDRRQLVRSVTQCRAVQRRFSVCIPSANPDPLDVSHHRLWWCSQPVPRCPL